MSQPLEMPRWLDLLVLPLFNLLLALLACGVVVLIVGHNPAQVLALLIKGAFGSRIGLSYTLYYATTFVFTGLAVAVAYHAGLALGDAYPAWIVLPAMVLVAMLAGVAWATVPAALQAWRGSHIVITTIMFNFLASALLAFVLIELLKEPGNMTVESRAFGPGAHVAGVHEVLAWFGVEWPRSPLNLSVLLAVAAALGVGVLLWHTKAGYTLRAVGHAPEAARYAGIRPRAQIVRAMAISGALAGLVGINEVAGVHGRLLLDYVVGAGFAGIAVSLIGRNHPLGIVIAALLFGALYQGGAELAFEIAGFSRDMVFTLQGLIVLFSGAMAQVAAPTFARAWWAWRRRRDAHSAAALATPD
jgi:general nucleoside transport system permease protein